MGWFDLLDEKRPIAGTFYLKQDEDPEVNTVYLFDGSNSISTGGQIHQIGWNQSYILFPDNGLPHKSWNAIAIGSHQRFLITESQRMIDPKFKSIAIMLSTEAWNKAKH